MNATQLDLLERVAIDELATRVYRPDETSIRADLSAAGDGVAEPAMRRLLELGLVFDARGSAGRRGICITPAGVEALAYLSSAD